MGQLKEELIINGGVERDEFKAFYLYHVRKSLLFSTLCMWITFVIVAGTGSGYNAPIFIISAFIIPLGYFALRWGFIFIAEREFNSNKLYEHSNTWSFTKDGINTKNKDGEQNFGWSYIRSAHELKDMFLLYISNHMAVVLPKRLFESDEQMGLFKQIVSDHIEAKKVKWQ